MISTRIQEWLKHKTPFLLGMAFMFLYLGEVSFWQSIFLLFPWFLSYLGMASFGYWINDCFDIEQDRKANKPNMTAQYSVVERFKVSIYLLALALLPWLFSYTNYNYFLWVLLFLQIGILLVYSIPPIRFKEKAYFNLVIDAAYAYLFPVAITWIACGSPSLLLWQKISLFAFLLTLGSRNYLLHLFLDKRNDLKAGINNLVNKLDNEQFKGLIWRIFYVELLCLGCFLILYGFIFLAICLWYLFFFKISYRHWRHENHLIKKQQILNDFYEFWFPLIWLGLLIWADFRYAIFVLFFIVFFNYAFVLTFKSISGLWKK
jgi:4-hydroxybenzoate polyprenyltransferase